jgi:hypothetical protein
MTGDQQIKEAKDKMARLAAKCDKAHLAWTKALLRYQSNAMALMKLIKAVKDE